MSFRQTPVRRSLGLLILLEATRIPPSKAVDSSRHRLVHSAQPGDQHAHDLNREKGSLLDKKLKAPLIDRNQLASGAGNGRRGSRLTVHHGHFTENSVRSDNLQELTANVNLHFALSDDIHYRPRVALLKDYRIRKKGFNGLISEHCERGHDTTPLVQAEVSKVQPPAISLMLRFGDNAAILWGAGVRGSTRQCKPTIAQYLASSYLIVTCFSRFVT